jgi:hypothetical protein
MGGSGLDHDRQIMSPVVAYVTAQRLSCKNGWLAAHSAGRLTAYSPREASEPG